MKIYVCTRGDKSVGIPEGHVEIVGLPDPIDEEEREDTRKIIEGAFSELLGEPAGVSFQDEVDSVLEQIRKGLI